MKRSYDFHEKISLKSDKKLHIPCNQSISSSIQPRDAHRNEGTVATTPHTSRYPPQVVELEEGIQEPSRTAKQPLANSSTIATDSFRSRITAKLRTALDGFVSELQSITQSSDTNTASFFNKANVANDNCLEKSLFGNNDGNYTAKLALQNFICSAKSQISGLLSKQQKANVISDKNCLANTKPFNVDPLQIQISLKLQDLLCNALDNRRFDNNATSNSSDPISETELQDLSHLLQDFLSSAKKKLSFSLNTESGKHPATRSRTCTAESPSGENQLSQSPINNKSLQITTIDKQQNEEQKGNEGLNKKRIQQRSSTRIAELRSHQVNENLPSQSFSGNKSFQDTGSDKRKIQENNKNRQVLNKKGIQESSTRFEPSSCQINKNQLFQPLNHSKSCQNKASNKCHKSNKVLVKQTIQEGSSISTESTSNQIDKNKLSRPVNQNKSCQTKELRRFNPISKPNSKIIEINSQPKAIDLRSKTMESYDESDSSSRDAPNGLTYMNGGILLLSECERTPDFLDLTLEVHDSDVEEPVYNNSEFIHSGYGDQDSDSDEDVVVLGEKRPTYQEITLDEDDDGEVYEKVIEMEKPTKLPKDLEDLLFDCPKCDKKFRVESLLKFHVRMHSVVESHGRVASPSSFVETVLETTSDGDCVNNRDKTPQKSKSSQRHPRKEKENNKLNSKSSHIHKIHREKHVKRKPKMAP